eukprot:254766-Pelagomonas_calceolata.AAC.1
MGHRSTPREQDTPCLRLERAGKTRQNCSHIRVILTHNRRYLRACRSGPAARAGNAHKTLPGNPAHHQHRFVNSKKE